MSTPVWPPTVAQLRATLRGIAATVVTDDELQSYLDTAVSRLEQDVGPRSGQQFVTVAILRRPDDVALLHAAASVESVTVDGVAATGWTFAADEDPGLLRGPLGPGRVVVHATARNAVPPELALAALKLAGFLARQDKVGQGRPGADTGAETPQGFAMPRAVVDLIGRHTEVGGFA